MREFTHAKESLHLLKVKLKNSFGIRSIEGGFQIRVRLSFSKQIVVKRGRFNPYIYLLNIYSGCRFSVTFVSMYN